MKKRTIVISLGGSLIVPEKPIPNFLNNFKKTIQKHYKTHKFVIVTGGGTTARKYITALKKAGKSKKQLSLAGIRATRANAQLIMQLFGHKESNNILPKSMKQVKDNLTKNKVVICGALRFNPDATTDTTAAKLANYLNTQFINMTNIKGLYSANPKTNKKAKFIQSIDWISLEKMANKTKHKPGQHFVIDQGASTVIRKHKIITHIIGPKLTNLTNILKNKKFIGTIVQS
jgi:uridylate kinase